MKLLMPSAYERNEIRAFVALNRGKVLHSTDALIVDYPGVLYNVTGSTEDPKAVENHKGLAWKALLNQHSVFSGASCYVTDPLPNTGSSHAKFDVGGHMTPNPDGVVDVGADSYLMPLCKWHNSTSRDRKPFAHSKTKMLKLLGFMQGDSATTFGLRMRDTSTLLYLGPPSKDRAFKEIIDSANKRNLIALHKSIANFPNILEYAIFEKQDDGFYKIITNLPKVARPPDILV